MSDQQIFALRSETSGNLSRESTVNSCSTANDKYFLSNSGNPMMSLVTTLFNGMNNQTWQTDVKMALGAKQKMGFVDGTLPKPLSCDVDHDRWNKCGKMLKICGMRLLDDMQKQMVHCFSSPRRRRQPWYEALFDNALVAEGHFTMDYTNF